MESLLGDQGNVNPSKENQVTINMKLLLALSDQGTNKSSKEHW